MQPSLVATVLVASSTLATTAFAVDYLSADQAQKLLLPAATQWQDKKVALSAEQLTAVGKLAGLTARSAAWTVNHGLDAQGRYAGSVVIDQVIGKFELITYAVGIDTRGAITGVEILSYRESHGAEIRLPAWRKQFVGKTLAQAIKTGDDIALISGATLSCNHVTDGVRRIAAVLAVLRESGQLPA